MDRLTTLVEKFHLTVHPATLTEANLIAKAGADGTPARVVFLTRGTCTTSCAGGVLSAAHAAWMGVTHPFVGPLPDRGAVHPQRSRQTR